MLKQVFQYSQQRILLRKKSPLFRISLYRRLWKIFYYLIKWYPKIFPINNLRETLKGYQKAGLQYFKKGSKYFYKKIYLEKYLALLQKNLKYSAMKLGVINGVQKRLLPVYFFRFLKSKLFSFFFLKHREQYKSKIKSLLIFFFDKFIVGFLFHIPAQFKTQNILNCIKHVAVLIPWLNNYKRQDTYGKKKSIVLYQLLVKYARYLFKRIENSWQVTYVYSFTNYNIKKKLFLCFQEPLNVLIPFFQWTKRNCVGNKKIKINLVTTIEKKTLHATENTEFFFEKVWIVQETLCSNLLSNFSLILPLSLCCTSTDNLLWQWKTLRNILTNRSKYLIFDSFFKKRIEYNFRRLQRNRRQKHVFVKSFYRQTLEAVQRVRKKFFFCVVLKLLQFYLSKIVKTEAFQYSLLQIKQRQTYKVKITKYRNICMETGRTRSIYGLLRTNRMQIKRSADKGKIIGLYRASW